MHLHRIRAVKICDILHRNPLAEVCLKAVHAHIQQCFQFIGIPGNRTRIGKVHKPHTCLPQICLPYVTICFLHQIAIFHTLPEHWRLLTDIRIDPYTDFQPFFMITLQHSFWIWEGFRVPGKITPLIGFHPVAVKMEYMKRNIPVFHSLNKAGCGCFIIIRGKGSSQPQTKGPCRRKSRFSGQLCVFLNGSLGRMAIDHKVIQTFSFHRKLHMLHLFTGNFISSVTLIVKKNSITFIGDIEWNIFIGNLTGSSAVFIPHLHNLTIFHKWGKSLTQTIDVFIHIQCQLFYHIGLSCFIIGHMGHIAVSRIRQFTVSVIKTDAPAGRPFINHSFRIARLINNFIFIIFDGYRGIFICSLHKWSPV